MPQQVAVRAFTNRQIRDFGCATGYVTVAADPCRPEVQILRTFVKGPKASKGG